MEIVLVTIKRKSKKSEEITFIPILFDANVMNQLGRAISDVNAAGRGHFGPSTLQKCCVIFYTTCYSTLFNYAIEQLLSKAVHNIVVKYIYTGVVQNFTNSCFIILINDWLIINKQALINSAMTIVVGTDQLLQIIIFHLVAFLATVESYILRCSHLINEYTIKMWFPNF